MSDQQVQEVIQGPWDDPFYGTACPFLDFIIIFTQAMEGEEQKEGLSAVLKALAQKWYISFSGTCH